jgi:hypothetical protein
MLDNETLVDGGNDSFMVYKYLSTERFFQYMDDYLDGNLYFPKWEGLNDPMEGLFTSTKLDWKCPSIPRPMDIKHILNSPKLDVSLIKNKSGELIIKNENDKNLREFLKEYKICSTSKIYNNILMWSHYADSHKGICIGIRVNKKECNDQGIYHTKVNYVDTPLFLQSIEKDTEDERIKKILSTKMKNWEYEDEYRFMKKTPEPAMFKIGEVEEIILGCENFCKKIKISQAVSSKNLGIISILGEDESD